jgi:hypothetical protein
LREKLDAAASAYIVMNVLQVSPTPRQLADRYGQIETAAADLLAALGTKDGQIDQIPPALLLGERPRHADLEAVLRLQQWARDHAAWAKTRPAVPAHAGDEALDEFVCNMAGIWRDVFGRQPGRSVPHREGKRSDGGPFPRFVLAALKLHHDSVLPTMTQISDRIQKLRRMGKL